MIFRLYEGLCNEIAYICQECIYIGVLGVVLRDNVFAPPLPSAGGLNAIAFLGNSIIIPPL